MYKYDEWFGSPEFAMFTFILLISLHGLVFLSIQWSVSARAFLCFKTCLNPKEATHILIIPQLHNGLGAICPLFKSRSCISFYFQKKKYVLDLSNESKDSKESVKESKSLKNKFQQLDYPDQAQMMNYKNSKGLSTEILIKQTRIKYGLNKFDIPIPSFLELFKEHMVAPFFVFQIFCVALWFLDEMWYYSLFTLVMLFVFESTVVFQRLKNLQEFRSMSIKPYPLYVYRQEKWKLISSEECLPGDIVSIVFQKDESPVPADMILLNGSCIANEAMLSGESTPQLKESIDLRENQDCFSIESDKSHVLFGGTKVLQVSPPNESQSISCPPDSGAIACVLRTGFATQQGILVRTIIYSTERVTANNVESFLFILFLLFFAIIASWYVWVEGSKDEDRSQSKLLLHCILIITSVVPPELPMELSMAVNNSLVALSKCYIFCTEPFRIPFAGRIDVACFDKTGTLTAENLIMEGISGIPGHELSLCPPKEIPLDTCRVLATAHALAMLDEGIIGDPMEKNTLESIGWNLSKSGIVKSGRESIKIHRRFQFSSSLKRMSTVSTFEKSITNETKALISVKGAPETLQGMFSKLPSSYEEQYKYWARRGKRVLALGYKHVNVSVSQIKDLHREQVESELIFAGFLVFFCPLKPDAVKAVQMLNESSHRVIMITGDNALTASHVAREVEISKNEILIADVRRDVLQWISVDESVVIDLDLNASFLDKRLFKYGLCVTGKALDLLEKSRIFDVLLPRIWIYARTSPSQKVVLFSILIYKI